MDLNKNVKAETVGKGKHLQLSDLSVYDSDNPKSAFANRHVIITFANGTIVEKEFPYENTIDSTIDVIVYENIFSKDSVVDIEVQFVYATTEIESFIFIYLSDVMTLRCRSKLANEICECNECDKEYRNLIKIDTNLTSARYAAMFKDNEKAQKFLDKCNEICDSLKNKNCKTC